MIAAPRPATGVGDTPIGARALTATAKPIDRRADSRDMPVL